MPVSVVHIQKVAGISGSENHLLTLLPRLREDGFEPTMLVLAGGRDQPGAFIERCRAGGVRTEVIRMPADLDPLLFWRLVRFLKAGAYDIVHTHLIHADLYATLAARVAGVKRVVSTRHNADAFRRLYPLRRLISWVSRYSHHVVCISENLRDFCEEVERIPREKMTVVRYGLNSEPVSPDRSWRREFGWADEVPVLGMVARLTAQKGHSTLLDAMPEVVRRFPLAQLVLVGDGELRDKLQAQAERLGVRSQVHFLGRRENAAAGMGSFDLFVHPSRWEGFGMVFLEAMAAGLPVVATRAGAIPEIVKDGKTGLLVPMDDAQALAEAICTLLSDRERGRAMGEAGRTRLEEVFTVERMVKGTVGGYRRVLGKEGGV